MPNLAAFVIEAILIAVGSILAFGLIESLVLKLRRHFAPQNRRSNDEEPTGAVTSEQA